MLISILLVIGLVSKSTCHDRPVIGVLAQESPKTFESMYSTKFHSAIIASYVKWIEASGGLVIPLWIGKDKSYYQSIMSKINGVLLPGGSVDINYKGGYADASEHIMKHATELNLRQDFFPVFGIGVGMDLMLYLTNDKKDISSNCVLDSLSASVTLSKKGDNLFESESHNFLKLISDSKRSALYNSSTDHIKRLMTQHPIAVFSSKKCYIKEDFQESKLAKSWIPFSYNYDNAGKLVVSAVEHELMPFYGTLFHPEKVQFEW